MKGNRVFLTLNATDGFWQILMDEDSKKYTGFIVDGRHYQLRVMPMGLRNSPLSFQRAMNLVLGELVRDKCLVYIDDIIVFGKDEREHRKNLKLVFVKLMLHGSATL
ncbi:MAG: reverse transcriptase family protein [bacterium]